jgi:hypothetical protein
VAALLEKKAKPDEAQGFNQGLVFVAQKVAEAAKEGGLLGFGGPQVSEEEAATIKDLSRSLGAKV